LNPAAVFEWLEYYGRIPFCFFVFRSFLLHHRACYACGMNVVIPKLLHKRVQSHARRSGVSEEKYVHEALVRAIKDDDSLDEEMRVWEEASLKDFKAFVKKHDL